MSFKDGSNVSKALKIKSLVHGGRYHQLGHLFPEYPALVAREVQGTKDPEVGRRRMYEEVADVMRRHVETALKQLSPRERSAFVLRHYQDLSLKEVAATMEVAEGTVKSLLFRATQKLRTALSFYREDLGLPS